MDPVHPTITEDAGDVAERLHTQASRLYAQATTSARAVRAVLPIMTLIVFGALWIALGIVPAACSLIYPFVRLIVMHRSENLFMQAEKATKKAEELEDTEDDDLP